MKQYKVIRVKMSLIDLGVGNYTKLEEVMNDMSKQGWEVVCTSPEPHHFNGVILVTFSRDTDE